jgi:DNA-binding CsgD family transcriptional regulator
MRTRFDDRAWLEFVAELMAEPLTELPVDQIALMLRDTFDAAAVAASDFVPGRPLTEEIYPLDSSIESYRDQILEWGAVNAPRSHPVLRYYIVTGDLVPLQIADVPEDLLDPGAYGEGDALPRASGMTEQVAMPLRAGSTVRSFTIARPAVFTAEDMALAGRIWRLLSGLNRQVRAYAAALRSIDTAAPDVASSVRLTPRERSVLTLLSQGLTAGAIARRLAIAERTVHKHLERCYAKLGVTDRLSAVLHAQRLGLVDAA